MTNLWIWNELEIEPTNDRRAIKRAYAKKSRLCHPEEKPEEFRRLHEAYRMALELAERQEGGKEWGELPGAASPAHAPAPDYRQLDELIARGLEQDYARDTKLLLEKMKRLHQEAGGECQPLHRPDGNLPGAMAPPDGFRAFSDSGLEAGVSGNALGLAAGEPG